MCRRSPSEDLQRRLRGQATKWVGLAGILLAVGLARGQEAGDLPKSLGADWSVAELATEIGSASPLRSARAAKLLGALGPAALPGQTAIRAESGGMRGLATRAEATRAALESGLQQPHPATVYWSAYHLGRLALAESHLRSPSPPATGRSGSPPSGAEPRSSAAPPTGGPPSGIPASLHPLPWGAASASTLLMLSQDPSEPALQMIAGFALTASDQADRLPRLVAFAEAVDGDRGLRVSAIELLGLLGPRSAPAVPALERLSEANPMQGRGDYHVGGAARAALAAIAQSRSVDSAADEQAAAADSIAGALVDRSLAHRDSVPKTASPDRGGTANSATRALAWPTRPNILWISCEDISPDLGCYGQPFAVTPRLDQLAQQGVRFERAFSIAGVCAISRSGIITGRISASIGSQHMRSQVVPPEGVHCFTERLRAIGYFCTNRSKTDYQFPVPHTAWDRQGEQHADWRDRPTPETPFFSVVNFMGTHESQIRHSMADHRKVLEQIGDAAHDPDARHAGLPPYLPDHPAVRRDWAWYHDNIALLDRQVGQLLDRLAADGLADKTLVVFWSDHGMGLPRGKRWLFDTGIRVPLIFRWPGVLPGGEVRQDLASLLDLVPTTLAAAGVTAEAIDTAGYHGRILFGPHRGPEPRWLFAQRDRMDESYDLQRACRDRRFKYILNFEPEKSYAQPIEYMDRMPTMQVWRRAFAEGTLNEHQAAWFEPRKTIEELYDTENDPWEQQNLALDARYASQLVEMRNAVLRWQESIDDQGMIPEPLLAQAQRLAHPHPTTIAPRLEESPQGVILSCDDRQASVDYRVRVEGRWSPWRLYTGPFEAHSAEQIEFVACRTGYADSPHQRWDRTGRLGASAAEKAP